jgi:hypothetical protein
MAEWLWVLAGHAVTWGTLGGYLVGLRRRRRDVEDH